MKYYLTSAYQCDKCERFFTEEPSLVAYTKAGIWGQFCSNCLNSLCKEMKNKRMAFQVQQQQIEKNVKPFEITVARIRKEAAAQDEEVEVS